MAVQIFGKGCEHGPPITGHVEEYEEDEKFGIKRVQLPTMGFVIGEQAIQLDFPDGDDLVHSVWIPYGFLM